MLTFAALCVSALSAAPVGLLADDASYETYLRHWSKRHADSEYDMRKALFEQSKAKVLAHNAEYRAGRESWYMALTPFADATKVEFAKMRSTKKHSPSPFPTVALPYAGDNPQSIDWRTKGAVTPVKNQGGCGSCWAFSATETVESAYQIASGNLLTLAPQTYVNCVQNPQHCGGTGGCEGATMELAFNLTVQTGIALEKDLPYQGRDEPCTGYTAAVKATGYVKNPVNDAAAFETALATKGPQAITVAAEPWQLYGGGVFTGCSGLFGDNTLDHGVQAVGYTQDYWIGEAQLPPTPPTSS
jgi:cathepsin L